MAIERSENEYCTCNECCIVTTGYEDHLGYWDICCMCGRKIYGGHHYYNQCEIEEQEEE